MIEEQPEQIQSPEPSSDDLRTLTYLLQNVKELRQVAGSPLDIPVQE